LKKLSIPPLVTIASLLVAPAVMAQSPSTPTAPSVPTAPSAPSALPAPAPAPAPEFQAAPAPAPAAPGDSTDTLTFRVGAGVEGDNNVLRQTNRISDTIGSLSLGAKLDKRYGLQRFRADVEASRFKYQDNSNLDYSTLNYNAAWDWSFTPRVHGVVSADRRQFRETSVDSLTGVNRVGRRTERTELAEGVYELGASWRALGGVSHSLAKSTEPRSWDASPDIRSAYVGAGYEFPSGTSLTARVRRGDGEYKDPTAGAATGDFKDNEVDLLFKWPITGRTAVEGRVGRLERKHDGAPQRDFSGMVASANMSWEITGKTRLLAGFARDLAATGLAIGGSVRNDRFYISPVWKPTAQTAVNLKYERVARDWRSVPFGAPDFGRSETIQSWLIGAEWEPRRAVALGANLRSERLKSNLPFSGYRATVFGVTGKVYF